MEGLDESYVHAVVNVEEKIGKTVGRRPPPDPAAVQLKAHNLIRALGQSVGKNGVFRFKTFEEADKWQMEWMLERAIAASKETQG